MQICRRAGWECSNGRLLFFSKLNAGQKVKFVAKGPLCAWCAAVFGLIVVAPSPFVQSARAQEFPQDGYFRAGLFAGGVAMNSVRWSGTGAINSLPTSASGHIDTKTGTAFGGLVGYAVTPYLNLELDGGLVTTRFKDFDGTIAIAGLGTVNGQTPVAGRVQTIAAFFNGLVTPFGGDDLITPYFGAGIGVAHSSAKVDQFSIGPVAFPVGFNSSETDLAADAVIGLGVKLTPQLALGIAYQYLWIDTKHLGSGATFQANTGHTTGNVLGVVLEYRFSRAP